MTDPAGLLTPPSQLVKVMNTSQQEINNSFATVNDYNSERGRYLVSTVVTNKLLSLKPENLQKASFMEKMTVQSKLAWKLANEQFNNPEVRAQMKRFYDELRYKLGFKPEYLMFGLLALFLMSLKLFGISKTFLVSSLGVLILVVTAPDLYSGSDFKTIATKFPGRWRDSIVQSTGFTGISEKMALGVFIVLILFSVKILVTPFATQSIKTPVSSSIKYNTNVSKSFSFEEMYKLGFDDGLAGEPFGSSLPKSEDNDNLDDYDWDLEEPTPINTPSSRKMGFSTILSFFALLRVGKQLAVGPDGQVSLDRLIANLKVMEPWKLGILGVSLYTLFRSFLF